MKHILPMVIMTLLTAGCASDPEFACGAPKGVGCMSVLETYEKSASGQLPETKAINLENPDEQEVVADMSTVNTRISRSAYPIPIKPGNPLLTDPLKLRIWITPWVDASNDFHEQSFVHTVINDMHWLLRENLKHLESKIESGDVTESYQQ